jgi:hypothetical protein
VRDLLKRMKLPKAAAKITPAGCGPISRYSVGTFRRWSLDPQLLGLLDPRSLPQRRQIELVSRIASATLAHTRITAATSDTMIRWCLAAAPELPAGRFGAKYMKLVRWMTDSVAPPRRGLRPRRAWTAKISTEKALLAAAAHAEALRQARKTYSPFALPDDAPGADDQWPRGGDLGDGISIRRLWLVDIIQRVGRSLSNCLQSSPFWSERHQSGKAAIYALVKEGEAIGAIALERDMLSALSISEQGGPCNAPLPVAVQRAVQKWVAQANAGAGKSATSTATDQP